MRFTIGLCPEEIRDSAVKYDLGREAISVAQDDDGNNVVTVFICPQGSECHDGLTVAVKICPVGEDCECDYSVDNLGWYDTGHCTINISWRNPDNCVLQEIRLIRVSDWEADATKYIHQRVGDPNLPVYPDGDSRNNSYCHGCGIGGEGGPSHEAANETLHAVNDLTPGTLYKVVGYFRDGSCGGVTNPVDLAMVVYQTTGLTSGVIKAKVQDEPPMYTVGYYWQGDSTNIADIEIMPGVNYAERDLYTVDRHEWEVDNAVMLVKTGTDFPGEFYNDQTITSDSVQETEELFIAPYQQLG